MRGSLPALLVAGLLSGLLSGCSSPGASPFGDPAAPDAGPDAARPGGNATAPTEPVEPGEPVALREKGEMLQPGTKELTWKVGPGATAFTVKIHMLSLQGAPVTVVENTSWTLAGGAGAKTWEQNDGYGFIVNSAGSCALCWDGLEAGSAEELVGQWSLRLSWSPSVAQYDIAVDVAY